MDQPAKVGRYTIVSEIGRGAMGVVYRATDPALGRAVAIKTINLALSAHDMVPYEERFVQEARAAGSLNHPNIVTIHDVGRSGELAYIAMELLDGRELGSMMASNELTLRRALDIAAQVAEGLAYAHERGVVHRDIKPSNIMVLPGDRVKIMDFGIAHMRTGEALTHTGVVLGSPRYLAPEQILQRHCDARSDIFSLGVTIYEMLTGRAAFDGADVNAILYQVVNSKPLPPSVANPALPDMLDLIIAKALAKDADARYASAAELAADLRECLEQPQGRTPMPSEPLAADGVASVTAELWVDTLSLSKRDAVDTPVPAAAESEYLVARQFDSSSAIARLAQGSGASPISAAVIDASPATVSATAEASEEAPRSAAPVRAIELPAWSPRESRQFLWAVLGSVLLAAAIALT